MIRPCVLLCLLFIAAVQTQDALAQQNPNGQLPVTNFEAPFVFLVRDPVVHAELKLTVPQLKELAALNDEVDPLLWSMRNKDAPQRAETMRKATEATESGIKRIFNSKQRTRLKQIENRTMGMRSFWRDDVTEGLGLSDAKRQEIEAILSKTAQAIHDLTQQGEAGGSREALRKQAHQLKVEEQQQILAALSREQQQQWNAMLGEPIDVLKLGRIKFKAPELEPTEDWINSPPLKLRQLQGKVVALHFYAFACINCQRNFPWYQGWQESFSDQGLVVLGIHTPETSSERKLENVKSNAQTAGLTFPILADTASKNWNTWGNSMWPSVYLIDKRGYVRYWWYGELKWQGNDGEQALRQRIEELIAEE